MRGCLGQGLHRYGLGVDDAAHRAVSALGRARFLSRLGYHTLCIALQAHGESPGEHITMGWQESRNAASAVAWLQKQFPDAPVAVLGTSLGGVAALLALLTTAAVTTPFQRP